MDKEPPKDEGFELIRDVLQDVPLHEGIKIPNVSKLRLGSGLMARNPAGYVAGLTLDETNVRELRLAADTSLSPPLFT